MWPEFLSSEIDYAVGCPRCGASNLHHRAVILSNPPKEDKEHIVVHLRIGDGHEWGGCGEVALTEWTPESKTETRVPPIDSPRRGRVGIAFDCEACGENCGMLVLQQHKGTSWLKLFPLEKVTE